MSRVDWAIARYNWYRACGLLGDSPQSTAEVATYQKSPDPPRAKPHLKWYPLSKPDDDIAATYEQPVATSQRHRYSQRVEDSRTQTTLAPHQSANEEKAARDDPRTWSRVDWAVARCNWYRACGLLEDLAPPTAETTRYQKSSESPRPKPHLKWYPLSKPDDDIAATYLQPVTATPPSVLGRRYCQRVEHARARVMLARYQAEKEKSSKGTGLGRPFVEAEHDRVPKGSSHGGEFSSKSSVSQPAEGKLAPVSTDKQQPSPADAERFDKILCRLKALHPNEYAFFVANRGSLADDGKTWNNWDQPLSWGEDNSVRIRSGAKSDFEILRFVINSIHRAPSYKPWLEAKIKSGAIKPLPEQPPELWSGNSTKAKAQREQWYQYMALAGATPNEVASLQNDVLRHEWFGQGGYVENGVMLAGSATSAFNIKAGGTGGPLMFKSKGEQSAAATPHRPSVAPNSNRPYTVFNNTHSESLPAPKGIGPNGGRLQSHHGLQQQWAQKNIPGYNLKLAPTVTIETGTGYPHTTISNLQNARRDARAAAGLGKWSTSVDDELGFIVSDFRKAGFGDDVVRRVLEQNYRMLDNRGVKYTKPAGF